MPTPKKTITTKSKKPKKVAVKKPAKKAVAKKTIKKAVRKKVAKKPTKRTQKAKVHKETSVESKQEEIVTIPSAAGPRLKEKVKAAEDLVEQLRTPVYRIAYVSAFCFILVGIFSLASTYLSPVSTQVAQICTTTSCSSSLVPDSSDEEPVVDTESNVIETRAVVDIFDEIPAVIDGEIKVSMRVQNASSFVIEVVSLVTGDVSVIQPAQLSNENQQFVIDANNFAAGTYSTYLNLTDSIGTRSIALGVFEILPEVEEVQEESEVVEIPSPVTGSEEPRFSAANPAVSIETEPQYIDPDTETYTEESRTEETINIGEFTELDTFILSLSNRNWEDTEIVRIYGFPEYRRVELFVRARSSVQSVFLGSMRRDVNGWVYSFDSNNLPDGEYEIFASTNYNGVFSVTRSEIIQVENNPVIIQDTTRSTLYGDVPTTSAREFFQVEADSVSSDDSSTENVQNIILDNSETINDLLQRYAVAKQSDNVVLIEAVEKRIEEERSNLVKRFLQEQPNGQDVSQVDRALTQQFEDLKSSVDEFEKFRSARSSADLENDTDKDGVSDWDEREVYNTDPRNPDSDEDGFSDGVEIIRGFNPLDSASESIIDYELPTEVAGLERSELLQVTEVTTFVLEDNEQVPVSVYAEIKGVGLPNSFVTLYIFSSPTIVTVKTDADGSFVYRFDKELEDGEHKVFVAFTDNTGSILAHSKPFSFVKQAEAFSPVDVEAEVPAITAPTVVETSTGTAVKFVLGISIIVLGFFLLMLGINLRESSPKAQTEIE